MVQTETLLYSAMILVATSFYLQCPRAQNTLCRTKIFILQLISVCLFRSYSCTFYQTFIYNLRNFEKCYIYNILNLCRQKYSNISIVHMALVSRIRTCNFIFDVLVCKIKHMVVISPESDWSNQLTYPKIKYTWFSREMFKHKKK